MEYGEPEKRRGLFKKIGLVGGLGEDGNQLEFVD